MHISIHAPAKAFDGKDVTALVSAAINDKKMHGIEVKDVSGEEISVRITTCDFDDFRRLPQINAAIGTALHKASNGRYDVVCRVSGHDDMTWAQGAYTGVTG